MKPSLLLLVPRYQLSDTLEYTYSFPIGLGYIVSVLKDAGYEPDCMNLNHEPGKLDEVLNKKLSEKNYDFVMTGGNNLIYDVIEKLITLSKAHPSRPKTILGGPIITSEPEAIFNLLLPDFGVIGEGEETILELLKNYSDKKRLEKTRGLIFRGDTRVVFTGIREPIKDLDRIPFPDFEALDFSKYLDTITCNYHYAYHAFDKPRVYPILGSRGCPFNCTFCYHYAKYRSRSLDNLFKEIEFALKKYKINLFLLYDESFCANKQNLMKFCNRMSKLRKAYPWDIRWSVQMTVHNADEKTLEMMKESGLDSVSYGFESMSSQVLKSMKKPVTPEMIDKAFHATVKTKIGIQANFIFGDRAETKETAKETLDWWKNKSLGQVGLGFIQPYPGSEIYRHCLQKGIIKDKVEFIKTIREGGGKWYNMTDNMTDDEIRGLRRQILDLTGKYLKTAKVIYVEKQKENIYSFTVKCPFCGKISTFNNCYSKNRWSYGFYLTCRDCKLRFFVLSLVQKLAYMNYSRIRAIRDWQKSLMLRINRKNI